MEILVNVVNQRLKISSHLKNLVDGSQRFVKFTFELDESWEGLTVFAQFGQDGVAYNQLLDSDNSAYLPTEIKAGTATLVLCGTGGNVIATTNYLTLTIDSNILVSNAQSTVITESLYQQLVNYVNTQTVTTAYVDNKLSTKANNLDLTNERNRAVAVEGGLETALNTKASQSDLTALDNRVSALETGQAWDDIISQAVSTEIAELVEQGAIADLTIGDGTLERAKVNSEFEETLVKADNSWQKSASDTYPMTPGSWEAVYDPHGYGHLETPQNPYDFAQGQDVNTIARMRGINRANVDDGDQKFQIIDTSGETSTYTGIDSALQAAYGLANSYTRQMISGYTPINIQIVQDIDTSQEGSQRTFYLVPKANGNGYDKWWYVTDSNHNSFWDKFGSSTTFVVSSLPANPDPEADYILSSNGEYQYFKYINNQWALIAGGTAVILGVANVIEEEGESVEEETISGGGGSSESSSNTYTQIYGGYYCYEFGTGAPSGSASEAYAIDKLYLDTETMVVYSPTLVSETYSWTSEGTLVSNPSESKDYFVQDASHTWGHFRYLSSQSKFVQIGISAYTREEIDAMITNLSNAQETLASRTTNLEGGLTGLTRTVDTIAAKVNPVDFESLGYQYRASLVQEGDTYTFVLSETAGDTTTPVSSFVLPAGGGGGSSSTTTLVLDRVTPSPVIVTSTGSVILDIDFSSTDAGGGTVDGSYTLTLSGRQIMDGVLVQGRNSFDVTQYCTVGTQKFNLLVQDEGGSTGFLTWSVQVVDVRLETTFNDRYVNTIGSSVNFTYTPYGATSKTVHFILDGVEIDTVVTAASGTLQSYTIPAQTNGSHLLEVYITATINNLSIETDHIYKDIIWFDESGSDPVIGCIYRQDYYGSVTIRQYNTLAITYNVYDPTTNYPIVKRYVGDDLISTETISTPQNVWNFKSDNIGTYVLRIVCRTTTVTINVVVTELGIDVSPVTGGLEVDFNPTGITNYSDNREWSNENYHMTVSQNFDWANGGYKTDENGDAYFLVKAGTTATFDYQMFGGGLDRNPSVIGGEMKIVFMTENVQDAHATWFSNVETVETEIDGVTETKNVGIQLNVHEGWLKTNTASDTDVTEGEGDSAETVAATNTYLYVPYSEEDIIELDINIDTLDREDSTAKAFVLSYEDGVPSKAFVYDNSSRFYQYTPQNIVIGSNYCDVRIYRLKIYSTSLTTNNIMRNFIADSRNSDTMLARYNRNSIYYNESTGEYTPYSGEGILDPIRLARVIPNVKVLMLETDHFTTSKKTFVKSTLQCLHAPGGEVYPGDSYYDNWLFENGWHSGQGTTSDNYGNAGRNVDFLFNCDGTHKPSDKVKNPESDYISSVKVGYGTYGTETNPQPEYCTDWKGDDCKVTLTRTSIPNNFFNLKVNIASSENVNNALFQKRYNDYLPYISPAKQRDSRIKNDMEFVPAVLFLKETNPDVSTHNEFLDTNWHFYALGNIGDSKKTDYTRAYDPADMNEFTIEISDNTPNNATFQTGVYLDDNEERQIETFTIVDGTPVSDAHPRHFVYPITASEWNNENNMRRWCLYNEPFDGDNSFEPRYACCGDYRDGKLVNDTTGHGAEQIEINNEVWRAFYRWVITSTDEQFVNELDQWCVRSAVEFFYAFTHIYTMMDNRAKNTFWHFAKTGTYREVTRPVSELLHVYCELSNDEYVPTEDTVIDNNKTYYTQYAFDLWMYDGDTAIGINNNGELVFPYGKEDTDYNIDGDPTSGYVFNGATSVFWCRLRDLLQSEIRSTFNSVVSSECFSATNLINQFDTFQECFPEEIWRLDIQRKYIRTFTGNSIDNSKPKHDTQYLRDMMQGKKKYQRRQWVRDQEAYFGTMNLMNTVVGDDNRITFRCFTPSGENVVVPPDYTLRITPYSDIYISVMFGNGGTSQVRAKGGTEYTIECPLSSMDDTQVTIYGANRIQALNDLSACYIAANNFSMATRLRRLVVGNTTEGYSNNRLISLTLGDNKLLEELDIRNCANLTGSINLSQCSNLLRLYAEGTKITGVTFATNGKIVLAHLPDTINTLIMRNLNNMVDFQAVLNRLETLTLQGGTLDSYDIVSNSISTLQVLNLYDIDWTVADTTILNAMKDMFYSLVTGEVYISGTVRNQELISYDEKWPDLEVTYDGNNLVTQFAVTYVNADENNTVLYSTYVDMGSNAPDPISLGLIDTPTIPSSEQYNYTFDGWENLDSAVVADRTVTAHYSTSVRTYTVNWYSRPGLKIKTLTGVEYGSAVEYLDENHLVYPTWTDGEGTRQYHIFNGWQQNTGFIRGDLDVYAKWMDATLPTSGTDMSNMTPAEIYGVCRSDLQDSYFEELDYTEITLGHDFDFDGVQSCEIGEDVTLPGIPRDTFVSGGYYFDGETASTTNIKLFEEDSPGFTMVIDFQFSDNVSGETLVSANDGNTSIFRLATDSSGATIYWGDQSVDVGYGKYRDIIALRHPTGSKYLYVYTSSSSSERFADSVRKTTLLASTLPITDKGLTFGGVEYPVGYRDMGFGHIHWCKIWYDDIGEECAYALASWPRETIRMEYWGKEKYYYYNTSDKSKASFICNSQIGGLGGRGYRMNSSNTNAGGWDASLMRTFLNDRFFNALPMVWQSIIRDVEIRATVGSQSSLVTVSEDKVYLPSYYELGGSGSGYADEIGADGQNPRIPWFTGNQQRIKFRGKTRKYSGDSSLVIYSCSQDPAALYQTNIEPGTIWINTNNSNIGYIFVSQSELDEYGLSASIEADATYANGGWRAASIWWERSPYISNSTFFMLVSLYGYIYGNTISASNTYGVVPGFSI